MIAPDAAARAQERRLRRLNEGLVLAMGLAAAAFVLAAPQDRALVPYRLVMALAPAAIVFGAAIALRRWPQARPLWLVRYAAPFCFLAFFFRLTGQIGPFFPLGRFDPWIVELDGLVFGNPRVSFDFQTTWPFAGPLFGELMCAAYVIYFLFIPIFGTRIFVPSVWRARGPDRLCAWYGTCVLLTYYLHYLVFFLFPVKGPAFYFSDGIAQDPGFLINRLHHAIVAAGDVPGGCFPSSHVAVALVHTLIAWRLGWRRMSAAMGVVTLSICLSIVYTRTHYASDAIAGLLSGFLCWLLVGWIERRIDRRWTYSVNP